MGTNRYAGFSPHCPGLEIEKRVVAIVSDGGAVHDMTEWNEGLNKRHQGTLCDGSQVHSGLQSVEYEKRRDEPPSTISRVLIDF